MADQVTAEKLIAAFESRFAGELEEARLKNGDLVIVAAEKAGEVAAMRRPTRAEYQRFKQHRLDQRYRITALERLVESCLLVPTPAEFERVLEKKPVLADTFGERLLEEAGLEEAHAKNC
jgi:hypothetical protein